MVKRQIRNHLRIYTVLKILAASLVLFSAWSAPVFAQSRTAVFEIQHQKREADRRLLVAKAMRLDVSEEKEFWHKYDVYRAKTKEAEKVRFKIVEELAANLKNMSEERADDLTQRALDLDVSNKKIKEKHILSLRKTLNGAKVYRYYQIETKLDAVFDSGWTRSVPLVLTGKDKLVAVKQSSKRSR